MSNELIVHIGDVFITHLSRLVDGYGLTILEAMSAGVPVITGYDIIKAKIFKHKHDIYYIKKDDPMALINGVIDLYKNPCLRRKMALNAYNKVNDLFNFKYQMHKIYLLFKFNAHQKR
jgi:glycosyltransferase involved in cell wall biosynthesis